MSILDRATNDALNAIIDLHEKEDRQTEAHDIPYAVCGHCTELTGVASPDFDTYIGWPCPTMAAILTVAKDLGPVNVVVPTPQDVVTDTLRNLEGNQ